jgi:hypothetical protein
MAAEHHAASAHEHRLHALGEERKARVRRDVGRARLLPCPFLDRRVAGVVARLEDRAALVVAATGLGRQGAPQDFARRRIERDVIAEREVVPADLGRGGAAREVQGVRAGAVTVAGGATRADDGGHARDERRVIGRGRVHVRIEQWILADRVLARVQDVFRRERRGVVLGGAVANPGFERHELRAREVDLTARIVRDVRRDEQRIGAVPARERDLERRQYLEQQARNAVRPVVDQQVRPQLQRLVRLEREVAVGVAVAVRHVAARAGAARRAAGGFDRRCDLAIVEGRALVRGLVARAAGSAEDQGDDE